MMVAVFFCLKNCYGMMYDILERNITICFISISDFHARRL